MSITPQAVQKLLDEVEKSRASRKRAWDNLQRTEWNVRDTGGTVILSLGKELTGGSKFRSNFRQ